MPELFSVSELINLAIREEETGATYYRALAEKTESADLKAFALKVAAMEDEHARRFRELLGHVGSYEPVGQAYEGEYSNYMEYMCQGRIFPVGEDGVAMAKRQASDEEAVNTAMAVERSTLLFYHELLPFVAENDRPLLDDIIAEERQHVTDFARYKAEHFAV
jgi:rubrerythrin